MNWSEHFERISSNASFGHDFGGISDNMMVPEETEVGEDPFQMEYQDTEAQQVQTIAQQEEAANLALNPDLPLSLSTGQGISQWWMLLTGQLNDQGTGPGPGFFGSTLGKILIGGGVLAALITVGPVLVALKKA